MADRAPGAPAAAPVEDPHAALERAIGHRFADASLLVTALRHRSWCAEHDHARSNERLEFLGDAVLGLEVTRRLYQAAADLDEGDLARLRAELVNARALAEVAREVDLGPALALGRGEENSAGREKPSILADAMEAVLGAVYLDGGPDAAAAMVARLWGPRIAEVLTTGALSDHKSRLQEVAAREGFEAPRYRVMESGPDHDKRFVAMVRLTPGVSGEGQGRTKKDAEQAAAADALVRLRQRTTDPSPGSTPAGNDEQGAR